VHKGSRYGQKSCKSWACKTAQEREGAATIATLHATVTCQEGASHGNRFDVFRPCGSVAGGCGKLLASRACSFELMPLDYYQYYKVQKPHVHVHVHVPTWLRRSSLFYELCPHASLWRYSIGLSPVKTLADDDVSFRVFRSSLLRTSYHEHLRNLQVTWITRHGSDQPTSVSAAFRAPAAIPTLPQTTPTPNPFCRLSRKRSLCLCVLYAGFR
jgi:hypothetical protein